jgi:ketosteroid isomerase-like protein
MLGMAMAQENVELVRQGFEAVNRGDRAALMRLLAPDVEWHSVAGPILGVGTIRGREAMLKFLWEDMPESIEGFRASPEELTDLGDDRVLVVARYEGRGRSSDAEVHQRIASVYEIRDGMAVTVRDYESREEALEAARLRA